MLSQPKPIVVVGSINIDLVATTDRIPLAGQTVSGHDFQIHPGGKGANQAVAVARLGYPVCLIARLGDDPFAAQLRSHLHTAGVDISAVATSPGPSGVALIVVSSAADNIIVVTPGANAFLTPADLDANLATIRSAGIVLAQLEIPLSTLQHLAHICTRERIPLVLDPAPATHLPPGLLEQVAWLTPNETEAAFYLRRPSADPASIAGDLLAAGPKAVVLKLGSRGALVASASIPATPIPPFAVTAIDTTAAGDCFNGAFATALMLGQDALAAARFAAAAAAISVTRRGAQPSLPTRAEVEALLA